MDFYAYHSFEKRLINRVFETLERFDYEDTSYYTEKEEYTNIMFPAVFERSEAESLRMYFCGNSPYSDEDDLDADLIAYFSAIISSSFFNGLLLQYKIKDNNFYSSKDLLNEAFDFSEEYYEDYIEEIINNNDWISELKFPYPPISFISDVFRIYGEEANNPVDEQYLRTLFDFMFGLGMAMYENIK